MPGPNPNDATYFREQRIARIRSRLWTTLAIAALTAGITLLELTSGIAATQHHIIYKAERPDDYWTQVIFFALLTLICLGGALRAHLKIRRERLKR